MGGLGIFGGSKRVFAALLALALLGSETSWGEDARVLPAGRSRFSFILGQTAAINKTFDQNGDAVSVTKQYNLQLDSANLRTFDPVLGQLVELLNATGSRYDPAQSGTSNHGMTTDPSKPLLGDALSKGFLGVDATAHRTQYNMQFQYGVTDRLSAGFMIPIISTTVRTHHAIEQRTATISDIARIYAGHPQIGPLLQSLDAANTETLQEVLVSKGYQRFGDYTGSGIGDAVFGGRYNYFKTRHDQIISSAQLGITAPTGRVRPPSNLTEIDNGSGVWDVGVANIFNYTPSWKLIRSSLLLSHGFHYTRRLPGQRLMRVRKDPSDFIPDASTEEQVDAQLGDKIWTNIGAKYSFSRAISIETNYEWYWKTKDHFQGSRDKDYTYLSELTDLYMETWNVGLSVSTIPAFLASDFPLPLDFSINYFQPTRGKNAVIAPYGTAELALYF